MRKIAKMESACDGHRAVLLEKRASVLCGLGTRFDNRAHMGRAAEGDKARFSHDEFVSLRMNGLDYSQLRLVEEALDRLDTGDYGVCLGCGEQIPATRVRARHCVTCQDLAGLGLDAYREPVGKG